MPENYERIPATADEDNDEILNQARAELHEKAYWRSRMEASLDADAIYRNQMVDAEQLIVNEDFLDRASFTLSQRKALRSSILDAEVIRTLTDHEAERAASKDAAMKQVLMFILAVVVNSLASVFDEFALTDPVTGRRTKNFISRMPSTMSYICSTIFATVASPILYGAADLKSLWDFRAIMSFMPVALAYCVNDVVAIGVVQELGGSLWKVMAQLKLLMTAVGSWIFLKRGLTGTQWLLLTTVSCSIAAYSLSSLKVVELNSYSAIFKAVGILSLTTGAGLMCEVILKREKGHFIVQFGRTRVCGLLGSIGMMIYEINKAGEWHKFPFGGWNENTPLLVIDDLARCWATTLIVKQLDSVWKTLAGALSLNLTYLLNIWLNPQHNSFDLGQFIVIMAIAFDIIAFAMAKQDEAKILQLAADVERKNAAENP